MTQKQNKNHINDALTHSAYLLTPQVYQQGSGCQEIINEDNLTIYRASRVRYYHMLVGIEREKERGDSE